LLIKLKITSNTVYKFKVKGVNIMYDIMGDIHGYSDELIELLTALGYQKKNSHENSNQPHEAYYQHPTNKVIFLGDFIDRGIQQRETLNIVMPMVINGAALTVMGNHELNAIAYHTLNQDGSGDYLRPHSDKNWHQHQAFLNAYPNNEERNDIIEWFKTLPLWLDLDELRIIHACWHQEVIERVQQKFQGNTLTSTTLHEALTYKTALFEDIETLLKGVQTSLPDGIIFTDNYGHERTEVRVRWWLTGAIPINEAVLDQGVVDHITTAIDADVLPGYCDNLGMKEFKPCFIGHYWHQGTPNLILPNLACVDYSVAKSGKLVAYCFKGEAELNNENFFWATKC
jgi:hypothetical protein